MTDPLELLWPSVDASEPVFTANEVATWPRDATRRLLDAGLLRQADTTDHVVCPACDEHHVEEVIVREGPDGGPRYFIRCPEALRVEVPADSLRRWPIDFDGLVKAVADAMGLKGRPRAFVPGRLWRLGKTPWQGANREVLFARGLSWSDARTVACRVGPNGRPIVLVVGRPPLDDVRDGRPPAVVVLSQVVTLDEDRLEVDALDLAARVGEADERIASQATTPTTFGDQKLAIRRQVKAEMKAQLEDDVLVAAYKEFGSLRKAARALTERLGKNITKDKINRAVQRAGGADAVSRTEDSQSVRRTVAPQRRDRTGKILHRPKSV